MNHPGQIAAIPEQILPAALTEIDAQAFMGADAVLVIVPEGCVAIGRRAFASCPDLLGVIVPRGSQAESDCIAMGVPVANPWQ